MKLNLDFSITFEPFMNFAQKKIQRKGKMLEE